MVQRLKFAGIAIAGIAFLAGAPGSALAGSKCASGEVKATGKKASCKAGVFSKVASKGGSPDPAKLTACETKFSAAYAKAQGAGDCTSGQTAAVTEGKVDAFVNDLNNEIAVSPPSKCQGAKLKAAGKKASCLLGVQAKAISKPPLDGAKHQACKDKFTAAFAKAATGTTCGASASATTIENKVDAFETDIVNGLNPPATTTSSTTTSSTTLVTTSSTTLVTTSSTTLVTTSSTTSSTTTSSTTSTTASCCGFPGAGPTRLSFTTGIGSGNCGNIRNGAGTIIKNLTCGGLYTGGGSNTVPLPYAVPDTGNTLTGISACNSGTNVLTFTNRTSAQTGSNRNCSTVGCLFGPPLPIPNSVSTPTSVCVVNVVATNASGTANCATGVSNLNLPLTSNLYLDGDLLPNRAGIQVCPVCIAGACVGGANDGVNCAVPADCPAGTCALGNTCHGGGASSNEGLPCTPGSSALNAGFPTSHDCPPPALMNIGGLPIAFALGTGTNTMTAAATLSGQGNVFCGYCRDINTAAATGCFRGDPDPGCPHNATCTAAGLPFNCCTGFTTGTCDPQVITPCTSAATCAAIAGGAWPDCQQRNPGAFGPSGGGARSITQTGSPAGTLNDGAGHASTLVSNFCIQPTFNATVDAAGDLPGPGSVSLPGIAQLLP